MSDWQPGDLALCVRGDAVCPITGEHSGLQRGRIYTVQRVGTVNDYKGEPVLCLGLVGFGRSEGRPASCFIKITPPEADEFDREVIELYTRKPEHAQHINRARHGAAKGRSFVPSGGRPTSHKGAR